jgi:hypothetical protein
VVLVAKWQQLQGGKMAGKLAAEVVGGGWSGSNSWQLAAVP